MSKPYVSVLIDTYNHERFIEQDMPMADLEIAVVDDGSTDRTPENVRSGYNLAFPEGCRKLDVLWEGFRFHANTFEGALLLSVRGFFFGTSRIESPRVPTCYGQLVGDLSSRAGRRRTVPQ